MSRVGQASQKQHLGSQEHKLNDVLSNQLTYWISQIIASTVYTYLCLWEDQIPHIPSGSLPDSLCHLGCYQPTNDEIPSSQDWHDWEHQGLFKTYQNTKYPMSLFLFYVTQNSFAENLI
jgi:hypothetical protein